MHRTVLRRYLKHGLFPQLAVFEACARLGSFTRAADELSLAQPTVSCQIRKLAETLGTPLFDTSGRQAVLTPAGRELAVACADIFASLADLDARMAPLRGTPRATLRIAATSCTQYRLGAALSRIETDQVEIALDILNRQQLIDALALRKHDFYLAENLPVSDACRAVPVREIEWLAIAHPGHALAGVADVPLAVLAKQHWIAREEGAGSRTALLTLFAARNIALRVRHSLGSNEAVRQAVSRNLGIALLPSDMFPAGPEAEGLVALRAQGLPLRQSCVAVVPDAERGHAPLEALLAALRC